MKDLFPCRCLRREVEVAPSPALSRTAREISCREAAPAPAFPYAAFSQPRPHSGQSGAGKVEFFCWGAIVHG